MGKEGRKVGSSCGFLFYVPLGSRRNWNSSSDRVQLISLAGWLAVSPWTTKRRSDDLHLGGRSGEGNEEEEEEELEEEQKDVQGSPVHARMNNIWALLRSQTRRTALKNGMGLNLELREIHKEREREKSRRFDLQGNGIVFVVFK